MGGTRRRARTCWRCSLRVPIPMPDLAGLHVERVVIADDAVQIDLYRTARTARCPGCRRRSHRLHSSYTRRIADLPIDGCEDQP